MAEKLKRYSPEWAEALQQFVDAGQRLLENNHDMTAFNEWSEAGQKLGWIVPIEPGK